MVGCFFSFFAKEKALKPLSEIITDPLCDHMKQEKFLVELRGEKNPSKMERIEPGVSDLFFQQQDECKIYQR